MADPLSQEQKERLDYAPLHVFRFHVSFRRQALGHTSASDADVPICQGAFSECTGLEATMEPKVIKVGGSNYGAAQRAGPVTFATVVLKRGMTPTRDLWNWFRMVGGGAYAYRLMVEVEMRNARDEAVVRWALRRAMPVKFKAADLNAKGSEVGIEELHLAHEGLVLLPVSGG